MNIKVVESERTRENSRCCGSIYYDQGLPMEEIIEKCKERGAELPCDDVVCYCVSCTKYLNAGGKKPRKCISAEKLNLIASYIAALAKNEALLNINADPLQEIKKMQELLGFETAIAEHIAMLLFAWPDAFYCSNKQLDSLFDDRKEDERQEILRSWKPWHSYVSMIVNNTQSI